MKLYNEEQIMEAMKNAIIYYEVSGYPNMILNALTPIELPSDEEIQDYIEKTFYGEKKYYFKAGVQFIKEQILNQNIPELRNADGTYGYWGTSGGNGKSMTNQNK